jgi:hypothetical protein
MTVIPQWMREGSALHRKSVTALTIMAIPVAMKGIPVVGVPYKPRLADSVELRVELVMLPVIGEHGVRVLGQESAHLGQWRRAVVRVGVRKAAPALHPAAGVRGRGVPQFVHLEQQGVAQLLAAQLAHKLVPVMVAAGELALHLLKPATVATMIATGRWMKVAAVMSVQLQENADVIQAHNIKVVLGEQMAASTGVCHLTAGRGKDVQEAEFASVTQFLTHPIGAIPAMATSTGITPVVLMKASRRIAHMDARLEARRAILLPVQIFALAGSAERSPAAIAALALRRKHVIRVGSVSQGAPRL